MLKRLAELPRAAYRLHQGLRAAGVDSQMLVAQKTHNEPNLIAPTGLGGKIKAKLTPRIDQVPLTLYRRRALGQWSLNWFPNATPAHANALGADLLNLHWIGVGFVPIGGFARLKQPLVWTLHDMWAFTGGCHYDGGCGRYRLACGTCPQLASHTQHDLSYWTWLYKQRAWRTVNLVLVTPSRWLANCVRDSSLLGNRRVEVIANGIDTSTFRPHPKAFARDLLGLPQDKKLILFGAANSTEDPRKGFQFLQPALGHFAANSPAANTELIIFGAVRPAHPPELGLPVHYADYLQDEISLSLLYAAADLFVAPSTQDNLPNTILEATACGIPSVAFRVGGIPDLIDHMETGYLSEPLDSQDLARGMLWVLADEARRADLSHNARAKAEQDFALTTQTQRYCDLYQELILQQAT